MLINKLIPVSIFLTVSACTTAPSNPIAANPVVVAKAAGSYEITVTGLPGKQALDVERGFHGVADDTCFTKGGWSGWRIAEGTQIEPVMSSSGVYVAKGQIVCSK